jgi:hypothetical protein
MNFLASVIYLMPSSAGQCELQAEHSLDWGKQFSFSGINDKDC